MLTGDENIVDIDSKSFGTSATFKNSSLTSQNRVKPSAPYPNP